MKIPSSDEILRSLLDRAKSIAPNIVWAPGLPHTDISITVPLQEFRRAYAIAEYIYRSITPAGFLSIYNDDILKSALKEHLNLTDDELNDMIKNDAKRRFYPLQPIPAKKSYGMVRVYLSSSSLTIPTPNTNLTFYSTTGIKFYPLIVGEVKVNFDSDLGLYYADIPIVSETTGSSTNVSAGSINSWKDFSGTVTNIVQVSNSSATEGGEDEEELEDFLERIAQWNMVQVPSLTSFIEQVVYTAGAIDVYIKWVGQPEYYRGYGMDVWVILPDIYVEASANSYEEIYEPVLPITQDPADNIYSGSIWQHTLNPGSYPYTYKYHPLVRQVQSALWEKGIWYIGSEDTIMVRLGRKVELDIDLYIRYNTSVNVSEVQSNVEDAVNNFFSEKGLGDRIDISDLIVVIGEVDGVDYIDTSQTSITDITRGKTYTPGEDAYITIDYWEYAKLGTLTINEV